MLDHYCRSHRTGKHSIILLLCLETVHVHQPTMSLMGWKTVSTKNDENRWNDQDLEIWKQISTDLCKSLPQSLGAITITEGLDEDDGDDNLTGRFS